ncbi:dispanin subfamily A member 2b-like [Anabas testudineus]|uniref:Uncharacterized protein n=1 Tax=Anabas testudineus TaxID=64144 RepID=A0AAQ6IQ46_ANATE|nr:dispanin subfamily A member 2b-like [Anabas testudineus]
MDSRSQPEEEVPLQLMDDGSPVQPGGAIVVEETTVDIPTEPPRDHVIWSLLCFFYSNYFCLGLVALIYSIKARDRKSAGDMEDAQHHGFNSCCLNTFSTALFVLCLIGFISLLFFSPRKAWNLYDVYSSYRYYFSYRLPLPLI